MIRFLLLFTLLATWVNGSAFAQQTITYTNGETTSASITITAPTNPTTLALAIGTATQSGVISESGTRGAVNFTGHGTLTLSGSNNYTGGTTISGGVLQVADEENLGGDDLGGQGEGGITLAGGELLTTTTGTQTQALTINPGTNTLATATGTIETYSWFTISGPAQAALTVGDANNAGTVVLPASGNYNGGTTIAAGILEVDDGGSFGTGAITVQPGATLSLFGNSATPDLFNTVDVANDIVISGTGSAGQGAIFASEGTDGVETLSGTVSLAADATMGDDLGNGTVPFNLGPINLSGHTLTLGTGSGDFNLDGDITGNGTLLINAFYVAINSGNNTFTGTVDLGPGQLSLEDGSGPAISGNLTVEDGAFVEDQSANQLTANTTLTLNGGGRFTLLYFGGAAVTERVAGLQSTSATSVVTTGPFITLQSIVNTLTLAGSGTYSYAGQITDAVGSPSILLNLVKQGPGTQILSGPTTYHGQTTVNGGILVFTQGLANTSSIATATGTTLNLSGGAYTTSGTITNDGTLVLGNGVMLSSTGTFTNNGTLDLRRDPSFVLPSNFVNNGTVLTAAAQTFAQWSTSQTSLTDQTAAGMPMKDGVPNLLKFLFDINPQHAMTATDRAGLPSFAVDPSGNLTLTFRESPATMGISIGVLTSSDMVHWTTLTQSPTLSSTTFTMQQLSTDAITDDPIMQVAVQPRGGATQFIRLGVTSSP